MAWAVHRQPHAAGHAGGGMDAKDAGRAPALAATRSRSPWATWCTCWCCACGPPGWCNRGQRPGQRLGCGRRHRCWRHGAHVVDLATPPPVGAPFSMPRTGRHIGRAGRRRPGPGRPGRGALEGRAAPMKAPWWWCRGIFAIVALLVMARARWRCCSLVGMCCWPWPWNWRSRSPRPAPPWGWNAGWLSAAVRLTWKLARRTAVRRGPGRHHRPFPRHRSIRCPEAIRLLRAEATAACGGVARTQAWSAAPAGRCCWREPDQQMTASSSTMARSRCVRAVQPQRNSRVNSMIDFDSL